MLRTFDQHDVRPTMTLDGRWDFVTAEQRKDRGKLPGKYDRTVYTPGAWELIPGLEDYRGQAWYRTHFETWPGLNVRLVFGGVSHTADVFLDGKHVGHHYDAFTPFAINVPASKKDAHELVVQVDNTFGDHSALHIENDYYTYGGITRPAEVQLVPDLFIERLAATPIKRGSKWNLDVAVTLQSLGKKALTQELRIEIAGELYSFGEVTVKPGQTQTITDTLKSLDVAPWTEQTPELYDIIALLVDEEGYVVDDLIDRVGFREVKVRGKKLMLNGEEIRIRGYNRHEDHPQFGCAIPLEAMVTDLEIMRDLGCNFVRTCHYPNDMRFLDLCDEMGIYVWEESHARNVKFDHPKFDEQIAASTAEMMAWHHNHPSIIMWGCLNECQSETKFGRGKYNSVLAQLKEDGSRPVTFASNRFEKDLCLDLVDIVSYNVYTGWYEGAFDFSLVEKRIKELLAWTHSNKSKGGKGKPVILSEFGAGAIYGWRKPHKDRWTEEYQAEALDAQLDVYLNHKDIVGVAIWQFCDVRLTKGWWSTRPRNMNNKGTVDEYRRPKLAYDVVKRQMLASKKKFGK